MEQKRGKWRLSREREKRDPGERKGWGLSREREKRDAGERERKEIQERERERGNLGHLWPTPFPSPRPL